MTADGMPEDRDELQRLLNGAYAKGCADAHVARDIAEQIKLMDAIAETQRSSSDAPAK